MSTRCAIYNEIDPYAAEWMENLERAGHIAPGTVDRRDIRDLQPEDVAGATQFHAFAGIAVWSHALRLAGWPDDVPVWTGSCPCTPFSTAGKRKGFDDEKHLWPEWFRLIRECRPLTIFGEQVASADGRRWFDVVSDDLEGLGYAVGAASIPACGVGAPHLRQRLFFVAVSNDGGWREKRFGCGSGQVGSRGKNTELPQKTKDSSEAGRLDDTEASERGRAGAENHPGRRTAEAGGSGIAGKLGDPGSERSGRHPGTIFGQEREGESEGGKVGHLPHESISSGSTHEFWADAEWIPCRDGKARPVKRGTQPLAHGIAGKMAVVRANGQAEEETHWYNRTGALRGIGNCIVPQVAAMFIRAAMERHEQ